MNEKPSRLGRGLGYACASALAIPDRPQRRARFTLERAIEVGLPAERTGEGAVGDDEGGDVY